MAETRNMQYFIYSRNSLLLSVQDSYKTVTTVGENVFHNL